MMGFFLGSPPLTGDGRGSGEVLESPRLGVEHACRAQLDVSWFCLGIVESGEASWCILACRGGGIPAV